VVEEIPRRPKTPEEPNEDIYDDQPAVFDMDDEETVTDSSNKSTDTDTSPKGFTTRPPRSQTTAAERTALEFMPSIAVSDQRSSGRLSSMSSSLSTSASAKSLTRLGMGHSVQPTLFGHSVVNSRSPNKYMDDEDDFEDDTTIVIAPHDVTAALSQPPASFGFVPPHLVSDIPEY